MIYLLPVFKGKYSHAVIVDYAVVDLKFSKELHQYRWTKHSRGYIWAYAKGRQPDMIYLHQAVWELAGYVLPERPLSIDHIDRDKMNCMFCNLRAASPRTQAINQGRRSTNKSGHTGVYLNKKLGKWASQITVRRKVRHLGCFNSVEEASRAHDKALAETFDTF